MRCDAGFGWRNPLGTSDFVLACAVEVRDDGTHMGKHSVQYLNTVISWRDDDRRCYRGEFPGWCTVTDGCVLPAGHWRECAL